MVVEPTYSYCPIVQKHMGCGIQYFIFGISKRYHPKSRHCPSYGSSMWYVYFIHPSSWESKDDGQINPTHTVYIYIYSIYVYTHNMYIYTNVPIYNNIIHISTDIKHPNQGRKLNGSNKKPRFSMEVHKISGFITWVGQKMWICQRNSKKNNA